MPSSTGFAATCSSSPSRTRCGRDGLLRLAFERRCASAPRIKSRRCATAATRCRCRSSRRSPSTMAHPIFCFSIQLEASSAATASAPKSAWAKIPPCASRLLPPPASIAPRALRSGNAQRILRLATGATLEYLPDHVVPHAGSMLRQTLRIEMQPGSRGIFLDAFAAGRVAQNEHWRFRQFDSRTEVTLRGKLIYLSRTKIRGAAQPTAGALAPEEIPLVGRTRSRRPATRH